MSKAFIMLCMLMILFSRWDQASDLWQQLYLAYELESDLWDTVGWGRKWLVDFNAGKLKCFCLTRQLTLVLLIWKWTGLFFRKSSFKIQGLNFSFKLDWASYIISIVKTATPKIGAFSFTCCLTWTLGSSLKCCQLKSFLYVLLW